MGLYKTHSKPVKIVSAYWKDTGFNIVLEKYFSNESGYTNITT